jgi:hypothetical protein
MKKNKHDEELLKRLQDEAPELLDAEISLDLDEAVKVLITADPNSVNLSPKRRKKKGKAQRIIRGRRKSAKSSKRRKRKARTD